MKTSVVALAAALLVASSSAALADHFYVGGYAGPNVLDGHWTTTTVSVPLGYFPPTAIAPIAVAGSQPINATGVNVGALGGYTWQFDPNWFAGIEVDFGINSDRDTGGGSGFYPCPVLDAGPERAAAVACVPVGFMITTKVSTNWLFTARPRLGYAWDNWAAYVTGGLAMTDRKTSFVFTDSNFAHASGVYSDTDASWTIGGGVEDRLSTDWTWRLEYLYADFGSAGGTSTNLTVFKGAVAFPMNVFTHHASLTEHMVRFALTYNLD
jgi:outer membrane immunogenic protein